MNRPSTENAPRWGYALLLRLHFYAGLLVSYRKWWAHLRVAMESSG